jgi:hypothetical protein
MSCIYKQHDSTTDGPPELYHRMNQMDCALKTFGGSLSKRKSKTRSKRKTKSKTKHKAKTRKPRHKPRR